MAAILKLWRHIANQTPSIDEYLLEGQSRQISSRSDLKRRSIRLFEHGRPNKNRKKQNKMSSDIRSVPDLTVTWYDRAEPVSWVHNFRRVTNYACVSGSANDLINS